MNRLFRDLTPVLVAFATFAVASAAELPQKSAEKHMGVATCAASQCHGSAIPRDATGVFQNEYVTWTQSDPHSRAYDVLNNELSRTMAARLGLPAAHTAGICLDGQVQIIMQFREVGDQRNRFFYFFL